MSNENDNKNIENAEGLDSEKIDQLLELPSETWEKELNRVDHNKNFAKTVRSTLFSLVVVAAFAVLVAVLALPVLRIYGTSMTPTLAEGNYVVSIKGSNFKTGDVIAFYYNNKILVKRVIAVSGDWIRIDRDGTVYVNDNKLDEPYVSEKAYGDYTDIDLPYQVPESRVFVLGDHRMTSVDSRSTSIGCIADEQIVGRIVFRIWPLSSFGPIQ